MEGTTMKRAIAASAVSLMLLAPAANAAETKAKTVAPQDAQASAPERAAARGAVRDPFKPETEVVLPPVAPECGRLCEFDLEQLRVAALVTGMSTPLAGVQAPNGKVYVVDRGTMIGKKGGRVVEIANGRITVEEPCKRGGQVAKCQIVLGVPKDLRAPEENLLRGAVPAAKGR
jgi:type IV pilus assembly protein PilP